MRNEGNMTFLSMLHRKLSLITRVSALLAADSCSKLKVLYGGLWFSLNDFCRRTTHHGFTVRLRRFDQTSDFRLEHWSDYPALWDIFIQDYYWIGLPYNPEIIIDLGSNIGLSLLYFRLRYPDAHIYGFEPDINNYRRLKYIAGRLDNVHVYNVAVSPSDGSTRFFSGRRSHLSSSVFPQEHNEKSREIEAKKLDTLMEELRILHVDLLKFNIEGAELDVFRNFTRKSLVRTYIGQIHSDLFNGETRDMIALFGDHDVEIRKKRGPHRCQMVARRKNDNFG